MGRGKTAGGDAPARPRRRVRTRSSTRSPRTRQRFERRRARPPKQTKAQRRMLFARQYRRAVALINECNRAPSLGRKFELLQGAAEALRECLRFQPGNRFIRTQLKICQGQIEDIIEQRRMTVDSVPLVLDPKWAG
jgi:hypothetical protein